MWSPGPGVIIIVVTGGVGGIGGNFRGRPRLAGTVLNGGAGLESFVPGFEGREAGAGSQSIELSEGPVEFGKAEGDVCAGSVNVPAVHVSLKVIHGAHGPGAGEVSSGIGWNETFVEVVGLDPMGVSQEFDG